MERYALILFVPKKLMRINETLVILVRCIYYSSWQEERIFLGVGCTPFTLKLHQILHIEA